MSSLNKFPGWDCLERILLVEDDAVDVVTVRRAFEDNGIDIELFVRSDGQEALTALRSGAVPTRRLLILLDLNMPRMNLSLIHI